jgi:hypothetical protein
MTKQKLELTWIGKEKRPKLEPRILLEDPAWSYHAKQRFSDADIFDNRLIFGDNLLALKALEQEFAGKVKCVFIDPPYNTGSAFTHYDDGVEHSIWLGLMRDRLEIIKRLLSDDGSLWITIDDNEAHYLKVMCDEIFGRSNFVSNLIGYVTEKQSMLTRLNPGGLIKPHKDKGPITHKTHRVHLPITTNNRCIFTVGDAAINLKPGDIWIIDNTDQYHSVENLGTSPRIHLIVDMS